MRIWTLWGLCALVLVACSSRELGGKHKDRYTLIVGRPTDAQALDPARVSDNESVETCEQIYEPLLRYRPGSTEVEAGLAERWEESPDGLSWTFYLRRGVRFHDGTEFDAAAVVYSFMRQLDENHPAYLDETAEKGFVWARTYRSIIKSVEELDEHTVRIVIRRKYAPFAATLAMFPVSIVSPSSAQKWGNEFIRHPIGTGPFKFVDWTDKRIVLERNEDYWGHKPYMKRLVFKAIEDDRQRLVALESEAIDVAYSIKPDELQFVALHPRLELARAPINNVAYLAFNTQRPPFDRLKVRQALNFVVNKDPIVKLAYQGWAVAADGPLPPQQWAFVQRSFDYAHDLERARTLLDEALAEGADFSRPIRLYIPTTSRPYVSDPVQVGQMLKAQIEELGLSVEIVAQPFGAHLSDVTRGEHDASLHGWVGDNGDPDNFLFELFDREKTEKGSARNISFLDDEELHRLLVAAQRAGSKEERRDIYAEAQMRIGSLAPWVPLAHSQVTVAVRSDVEGVVLNPTAHVSFVGVSRE